jgi:hypothetical protein
MGERDNKTHHCYYYYSFYMHVVAVIFERQAKLVIFERQASD